LSVLRFIEWQPLWSTVELGCPSMTNCRAKAAVSVEEPHGEFGIWPQRWRKADIADMATKADVRAIVRDQLAPIRSELKSIRRDLDDLREKVENVIGFQREIDHAFERIAATEKHLGINKKIAA
jgi:hypothetical protein